MAVQNNNFGSRLINGLVDLFKAYTNKPKEFRDAFKDTVPVNISNTDDNSKNSTNTVQAKNQAATQPETKSYYDSLLNSFNDYSKSMYDTYAKQAELSTAQAYALKRKQQQDAERDFYNQLYDTNATVLDTIRRNNAAAIASGASKGAQAANELSAILQGQQASVDAASQLAQSNYDLASEEAAAYIGAEQTARQQADTAAGALAGNLAVAAQADAAVESSKTQAGATVESANIDADNAIKTSEVAQLQDAVKKYLDPNSDETTKMTNKLIIESLTGQTLEDLGFKTTSAPVDSNIKNVETTASKYDNIINNADHPETARQWISKAIQINNEAGGSLEGHSYMTGNNPDLIAGIRGKTTFNGIEYTYRPSNKKITYDKIKNDVLRAVVDELPHRYPVLIDGEYYLVDKVGQDQPILQHLSSKNELNDELIEALKKSKDLTFNFTNKKNN